MDIVKPMSRENDMAGGDEEPKSNLDDYEFTFHSYRGGSSYNPSLTSLSLIKPGFIPRDGVTLTESVTNFPELFGRSYHAYKEGSYHLPCDALEQERLEFQNVLLVKCTGGQLIFSPFSESKPPRSILDIATGTGDWPMAIGDLFPTAKIIATDLSPIQPIDVPPNVTFFVEDSSEQWLYDEKFDYIHTRNTGICWSNFETQVAQQAFDSLIPGGWFEAQELHVLPLSDDGTLAPDSALSLWCEDLHAAAAAMDRPLGWMPQLRSIFERVGFVDVEVRVFKMPLNGWPKDEKLKELGQMWEWNMQAGIKGLSSSFFHHVYDRSEAEIEVGLVSVRREIANPEIHAYLPFYVVWGRKPVKPKKERHDSNARR